MNRDSLIHWPFRFLIASHSFFLVNDFLLDFACAIFAITNLTTTAGPLSYVAYLKVTGVLYPFD